MNLRWEIDPSKEAPQRIWRAARKAMNQVILALEGYIKVKLTGKRSGRIYRRGKRIHQASAPGEAPAVDTGFLRTSIAAFNVKREGDDVIGQVAAHAKYAIYLEKGTRKMKPRPFLMVTLKERGQALQALFNRLFWGFFK